MSIYRLGRAEPSLRSKHCGGRTCVQCDESNYGSDLLNLVVAKGYLTKLLANEAVKSYIGRHEPEILAHLELVVNTVRVEEEVQQQQEAETQPVYFCEIFLMTA